MTEQRTQRLWALVFLQVGLLVALLGLSRGDLEADLGVVGNSLGGLWLLSLLAGIWFFSRDALVRFGGPQDALRALLLVSVGTFLGQAAYLLWVGAADRR